MRLSRDWLAVLLAALAAVLVKLGLVPACRGSGDEHHPRAAQRRARHRAAGWVGYAGKLTEQSLTAYGRRTT